MKSDMIIVDPKFHFKNDTPLLRIALKGQNRRQTATYFFEFLTGLRPVQKISNRCWIGARVAATADPGLVDGNFDQNEPWSKISV